jgi:hypothetical protein
VITRWQTFVQVLMALLALGVLDPVPGACAALNPDSGKASCCASTACCACHDKTPCRSACSGAPVHNFDKQVAARLTTAKTTAGSVALFSLPATEAVFATTGRVARRSELKPPPPGGSPPQARLCLWLV